MKDPDIQSGELKTPQEIMAQLTEDQQVLFAAAMGRASAQAKNALEGRDPDHDLSSRLLSACSVCYLLGAATGVSSAKKIARNKREARFCNDRLADIRKVMAACGFSSEAPTAEDIERAIAEGAGKGQDGGND